MRPALSKDEQVRFDYCRERALECLREAQKAQNESSRAEMLKAADAWLERAVAPVLSRLPPGGIRLRR
jgi:hypothetical protein